MTTSERIVEAALRLVDADDLPAYEEAYADLRDALGLPDHTTAYLGSGVGS